MSVYVHIIPFFVKFLFDVRKIILIIKQKINKRIIFALFFFLNS